MQSADDADTRADHYIGQIDGAVLRREETFNSPVLVGVRPPLRRGKRWTTLVVLEAELHLGAQPPQIVRSPHDTQKEGGDRRRWKK